MHPLHCLCTRLIAMGIQATVPSYLISQYDSWAPTCTRCVCRVDRFLNYCSNFVYSARQRKQTPRVINFSAINLNLAWTNRVSPVIGVKCLAQGHMGPFDPAWHVSNSPLHLPLAIDQPGCPRTCVYRRSRQPSCCCPTRTERFCNPCCSS